MGGGITLSARMKALTDMVSVGNRVCDVGCDHGWVSIYLVQQGISPKVLAMDVRQGPLSRAQEHIRQQGLEAYIETRLSDGVSALEIGETDTMICAGMGGRLMQRILEEGKEKTEDMQELILQPQSEIPAFRAYLRQAGYVTVAENMIYEDGKYYPMMKVVPRGKIMKDALFVGACVSRTGNVGDREICGEKAEEPHNGKIHGDKDGGIRNGIAEDPGKQLLWDHFGQLLLEEHHSVLKQYLLSAYENNRQILQQLREMATESGRTAERVSSLELEQELIRWALACYE